MGLQCRELWMTLALHDVRQRYRRSTLGPFWITLSMGIMILALALVYGRIFGQDLHEYLPFLAAGFVVWGLISSLIIESCQIFIASEGMIRQLNAPLSIYAYRSLWSALIIFFHNIWVFFAVAFWYGREFNLQMLWIFPALLLLLLNGLWIALFLGLFSARFRDVPLITSNIVQVLFFITPVIWRPDMLPGRTWLLVYNPLYHLVEILRAPLLGQAPAMIHLIFIGLLLIIGWIITLIFYSAYSWRIPYWV